MISALIIDDEPKAIKNLTALLKPFTQIEVIGFAQSASAARQILENAQPDLIFLDVNMPNESGFDFLESLPNRAFEVIFITAHHEYALRALRANALDYLQKPVDIDELASAITRVEKTITNKKAGTDNAQIAGLIEMVNKLNKKEEIEKITVPHIGGFKVIELKDIMYFDADGNYTTIFLQSMEKIVVTRQLGNFEDVLPENTFFRIHKSTIVNLNYITGYSSSEGNIAIMKDGNSLTISRRRLDEFLSKFEKVTT
jgi:two-component system, LytTR family, response regulator